MLNIFDNFEAKTEGYLPFTPINIAYRHLDKKAKTILDLGCGKGDPMLFINRRKTFQTVGVDIFTDYLKMCHKKHSHDEFVQSDIRELSFPKKSFDIALALRVLEHLTKDEGSQLLQDLETIARSQVIIITPIEQFKQSTYDHNIFQEHKYIWSPVELKSRGYKVYLNGIKGIQKDSATITRFEKTVAGFGHVLWVLAGPVVLIFPSIAANVVAVKNVQK